MLASVDVSKNFLLIPEKLIHSTILVMLQLCNSTPHWYANFNFVVLSVIIAPHNFLIPHISKTYLPRVQLNAREPELD